MLPVRERKKFRPICKQSTRLDCEDTCANITHTEMTNFQVLNEKRQRNYIASLVTQRLPMVASRTLALIAKFCVSATQQFALKTRQLPGSQSNVDLYCPGLFAILNKVNKAFLHSLTTLSQKKETADWFPRFRKATFGKFASRATRDSQYATSR
jgi:hypothetical protein